MNETNDLFEEIKCKLSRMIGDYGIIKKQIFHDEIFKDIEAYGKTEFERGYKTACTEKRFESDTHFYDLRDANKTLKDQNKELMRENAKLRELVNDQSLMLVRMKDIKDENNYLMDKITDYEKGPKQYLKDILNNISLSGVSEEMLKGFNECKDLIDIMMYDVNSDEDLARKAKEPGWYEAKKRLPLPHKAIIVKWRYADE